MDFEEGFIKKGGRNTSPSCSRPTKLPTGQNGATLPTITLTMVCPECIAVVNYTDIKMVKWHTDRLRINALAEAEAWVKANPKGNAFQSGRLPFVSINPLTSETWVDAAEVHYLICPICAGRMYRGEDAQEESHGPS